MATVGVKGYACCCRWENGLNSSTGVTQDVDQTSSSTLLLPPPRSLSFYDNLSLSGVSADPQSELEMILDDLRRNIFALDAALNSPSTSSHGRQYSICCFPQQLFCALSSLSFVFPFRSLLFVIIIVVLL